MKQDDLNALANTSLFRDVPSRVTERLASSTIVQTLPKNTLLFEQGQEAEFLHVLLEGRCGLVGLRTDGQECVVEILTEGDCFIIPAVMMEAPYLMSARILDRSRIAMIAAASFRREFEAEPALMRAASLHLSRHWRMLVRQIKDLKLRTAPERVAAHLSELCRTEKNGTAKIRIDDDIRDLSARLGMTPETWSRSVKLLASIGVTANGKSVDIADVGELRRYSRYDDLR